MSVEQISTTKCYRIKGYKSACRNLVGGLSALVADSKLLLSKGFNPCVGVVGIYIEAFITLYIITIYKIPKSAPTHARARGPKNPPTTPTNHLTPLSTRTKLSEGTTDRQPTAPTSHRHTSPTSPQEANMSHMSTDVVPNPTESLPFNTRLLESNHLPLADATDAARRALADGATNWQAYEVFKQSLPTLTCEEYEAAVKGICQELGL